MQTINNGRVLAAEIVGTAVLMLGGPGTAILAGDQVGPLGIAFGFGLSVLVMSYVIGPVSGCHINPAVTLGMLLGRKITTMHAVFAWIGQVIGAIGACFVIWGIANGRDDWERGQFAANLWSGKYFGLGATIVTEVVLTAVLVLVVLSSTNRNAQAAIGGIVTGLTLTMIHLISIPVDNTSVNPARSLGTALFADSDYEALQQLWAFIVFPMLGAVVGVMVWLMVSESRLEDTMLADVPGLDDVRDGLTKAADVVVDAVEDAAD
jgi:aquaporin Z